MKVKNKLLVITNFIILAILVSNISYTQTAIASWDVGSYYTYEYRNTSCLKIEYLELDSSLKTEINAKGFYDVNITDINNSTKEITYDVFSSGSKNPIVESYDWEDMANIEITLSNMLTINYEWDIRTNETKLAMFTFVFSPTRFIDPNWTALNNHFVAVLNESEIIDTVVDPYTATVHNITFGDFLNNLPSYKIQEQETLVSAIEQFTTTTTKWTFEFTLTGVFNYEYWNSTLGANVYDPYDEAYFYFEVEYESGGVLKYIELSYHNVQTHNDVRTTDDFIYQLALGMLPETKESNFAYLIIIPALFVATFIFKKYKKN